MPGIYIHIPFCSRKCIYCDFYSIIPLKRKEEFIQSLLFEIDTRKNYLDSKVIDTLYFGGGTPSLLSKIEVSRILNQLAKHFTFSEDFEFTFEANPENLSSEYISNLKQLGVSRLSIGVQSFNDKDLTFLKRKHSAQESIEAIHKVFKSGIENISIDLIYGLPNLSLKDWEENLETAFNLPISHLSAYHLTFENGTLLYKKWKQGEIQAVFEEESALQFKLLLEYSKSYNFPLYEISNFAKEEKFSKHNVSYWQQKQYLGLGPSSHSYNGISREWNVSNLNLYIEGMKGNQRNFENEILSPNDFLNEFLITNLRTKWGIDLALFSELFTELKKDQLINRSQEFIKSGLIIYDHNKLILKTEAFLISDFILEKLIVL